MKMLDTGFLKAKSTPVNMDCKLVNIVLLLCILVCWQVSTALAQTTSGPEEDCVCSCIRQAIPTDDEERQAFIDSEMDRLQKNLFVDKTKLSSSVRKKSSAEDDRPSARNVGAVGIAMLALFGMLILLFDTSYIITALISIKQSVLKTKNA